MFDKDITGVILPETPAAKGSGDLCRFSDPLLDMGEGFLDLIDQN